MENQDVNKKYDLEIKLKEIKDRKKPAIFDDSSSSEDESSRIPTLSFSSSFKKQDTSKLEKALQENPTIYDYDSVYEQISTATSKNIKSEEKHRPKLAKLFIESAEKKNMRYQVVLSKKAKKENEVDKKEVFVTSAYKKEHEKLLAMDREDRKQQELEKQHDPTKQSNTSAIYRHLLEEKLNLNAKSNEKRESLENAAKEAALQETAKRADDAPAPLEQAAATQDSDGESEIVKQALQAKLVREKAALYLQKPDTNYMREKFAKKNDDVSISQAKERFLQRKGAQKRAIVEDDESD